jgi:hypothetical protein
MAIELDSRHLLLPKTEWENEDLTLISREIKGKTKYHEKIDIFLIDSLFARVKNPV